MIFKYESKLYLVKIKHFVGSKLGSLAYEIIFKESISDQCLFSRGKAIPTPQTLVIGGLYKVETAVLE